MVFNFSLNKNKDKNKKEVVSIPVPEAAEARWKKEDVVPWLPPTDLFGGREGDLALDVYVADQSVVVRTALAGVSPDDISIQLMNDLLTIRGVRREEEQILDGRLVVQECHWGSFSRSVVLPVPVRSDGANATLKNGILKIVIDRANTNTVPVNLVTDQYAR
jgi:HSP20 family molecular chaperone IbpA